MCVQTFRFWVDALEPSQHFGKSLGIIFFLPGLNQYYAAIKCSDQGHNTVTVESLINNPLIASLTLYQLSHCALCPNFRVLIKENFTATAIVSWAGALFLHATDPFIDTITQAVCTCFTCPLLGYKQYKRISKTDRCSPNKCLLKKRCKLISLIVLMLYSGQNLSITKGNNFSIMQKRVMVLGHCISPH